MNKFYFKIITHKTFILLAILLMILLMNRDTAIYRFLDQPNNIDLPEKPFDLNLYNKTNNILKTIIVSHFTIDNNHFIKDVIKNHRKYAKKHSYDYWFRNGIIDRKLLRNQQKPINYNINTFGMAWQKLPVIQQAMDIMDGVNHKYEWILWIDGDAVFTNINKSLDDLKNEMHVTDKHFLVIAKDMCCGSDNVCPVDCCFNAGILLIRNNQAARQFIQNIIDSFSKYKDKSLLEQAAIQDQILGLLIRKNNTIKVLNYTGNKNKCNIHPIPGIMIVNSTTINSGYVQNWKPGHFICHFAGIGNITRNILIPKFLKRINSPITSKNN